MAKDRERALKWKQRADDWVRLSVAAREQHVADVCAKFAGWSYDMANFHGGVG